MIQAVVAVLLFFVIFFGISFILNMLLRMTWFMSFIYPFIVLFIVDKISITDYFTGPKQAFITAYENFMKITVIDVVILFAGFAGTIVAGFVIRILRRSGYQMF